MDTFVTDAQNM